MKRSGISGSRRFFVFFGAGFFLLLALTGLILLHQAPAAASANRSALVPSAPNPATTSIFDPNREVRGLWIPSVLNLTFPSKPGLSEAELRAELTALIQTAKETNLNTLCLQVRPSADALYHSDLFPASSYLSGTQGVLADGGFDPLAELCTLAAEQDPPIAVYAWVNPLRVTSAGQDASALAADNPAVLHPDWNVSYNGAIYWNAGIPAVREYVAAGVREICEKYPVAGVIFDDYFYPYPVNAPDGGLLPFDDETAYQAYGAAYSDIGDFRRDCVNHLIKSCYEAVKDVSSYMQFGVAPFGIWQNDDGKNGGSDTAGLCAYSAIYCDALAWMEGGYVDFIAPQIYWTFTTAAARYDTLVRFWNAQCDRTHTKLWISHAAYQYDIWNIPGEMLHQITFARSECMYRGSLFYGYGQIRENTVGITDEIRAAMADDIIYYETGRMDTAPASIVITTPANNSYLEEDGVFLLGQSDPHTPVSCNGKPVSRTRSGYFSMYQPLMEGKNTFLFEQNGEVTPFVIWKGRAAPDTGTPPQESFAGTDAGPQPLFVLLDGTPSDAAPTALPYWETLSVAVYTLPHTEVQAMLDAAVCLLSEGETRADGYAVYTGTLSLPEAAEKEILSLGRLSFLAQKDGETTTLSGGDIYVLGDGAKIPVEVQSDDVDLKTAPNSWYYDDYAPAMQGMRVNADRIANGYAELTFVHTAYLDASRIRVLADTILPDSASLGTPTMTVNEKDMVLTIPSDVPCPVNCIKDGMTFTVMCYHAEALDAAFRMPENPLFQSAFAENRGGRTAYVFTLMERDRFYGFTVSYTEGAIHVSIRTPQPIDLASKQPLAGKTIVLDAGHGGADSGALTPGSAQGMSEKDCNLKIVLETEKILSAYGATVILLRDTDTTVSIYDRMDKGNAICPDLLLSIHQNSMPMNTDITHVRGVVGLYWTESGRSLADCVSTALSASLGRYQRETASQRLAMLRNYKFPSALIEVGFVTNPEEFETLTAAGGIQRAANGICDGILAWYASQK